MQTVIASFSCTACFKRRSVFNSTYTAQPITDRDSAGCWWKKRNKESWANEGCFTMSVHLHMPPTLPWQCTCHASHVAMVMHLPHLWCCHDNTPIYTYWDVMTLPTHPVLPWQHICPQFPGRCPNLTTMHLPSPPTLPWQYTCPHLLRCHDNTTSHTSRVGMTMHLPTPPVLTWQCSCPRLPCCHGHASRLWLQTDATLYPSDRHQILSCSNKQRTFFTDEFLRQTNWQWRG